LHRAQGRWVSPDPAGLAAVDPTNPQTWNRYAYVSNNPLTSTDPNGTVKEDFNVDIYFKSDENSYFVEGTSADMFTSNVVVVANTEPPPANGEQEAQNQQTPQSLADQVPAEAKAAIGNALNATNAPTADDKKGGFHEESVKWGKDASGNVVVSPSVPGAYAPPGTNPHTNFTPANPQTDQKLVTVDGFAHIHPRGDAGRPFNQFPSDKDKTFAGQSSAINLVVGAADRKVYFFNGSGQIGKPMKLKDFMGD